MIYPEIIDSSPILRDLIPPVDFHLTDRHQKILLKYLSESFYQLPQEVWTREILELIDYLLLPADKLIDYYIISGFGKSLLERFRLYREPSFTLFDCDNSDYCTLAAKHGHLEIFKWAIDRYPTGADTYDSAARNGHLHLLKWAQEQGRLTGTYNICSSAAEAGHLEILKWARDNDCPWNEDTCARAARGGHLEVLKWARENGCPFDPVTYAIASFLYSAEMKTVPLDPQMTEFVRTINVCKDFTMKKDGC